MLRDPGPARSAPKGGRPRRHGGALPCAKPGTWHPAPGTWHLAPGTWHLAPGTWHLPEVTTATNTTRYGNAEATAWDRMHPRLAHRGPWLEHAEEELPILHSTLIRLKVERLPDDRDPKPVWLWCSATAATGADVDRWWQSSLRRFDLEHTFRLMKQTLGWSAPKIRHADSADLWTWLIIAAHTQLRLARPLAEDLRRPWERPAEPRRLTPARVRRGLRNLRATATCPAAAPKPSRLGPGRPAGSKNRQRAKRHDVGKTVKRAESIKEHQTRRG
ncbi:hypothetical protein GCM10020367_63470 [Streptomyces sannanensis]|uniref:Transposase n=1 Tax=Streptomyces sannanensis TaxID=285536 RepID=A0ABP6SMM8_9ACTN